MTEHIPSPAIRPLWEEFYCETPEHLFALMADEMWERTGALDHAARIAEAELAHVRAPGDRRGQLRLDDAYHDEASARAASAILLGFCLGAMARPSTLPAKLQ